MKQTFKIPDGCKEVTIEQIDNQIVTTFEPKKYTPKVGDYVKMYYRILNKVAFCKIQKANASCINSSTYIAGESVLCELGDFLVYSTIEQITLEDYVAEFEKRGYTYDEATDTAIKKRWRANLDREYYFMSGSFEVRITPELNSEIDDILFKNGNYYKTKEQAEQYRDFMLQKSLEFNTNNK